MPRRSDQRTTPRPRPSWRTIMVPVASAAAMTMLPPLAAQASTQAGPASPPPVTILTAGAHNGDGDIVIAPFGDTGSYTNGPEIRSPSGRVNGYSAGGHEFLITPQGTALILAYTTATADLTAIGGRRTGQ